MSSSEQILSDEALKQYLTEEQLKDILSLFSSGKFLELINKYIMTEDKTQPQVQTPIPTPNIMFSTIPPVISKPAPKYILNLDLLEKIKEDKLSLQIISTILIFCLLKENKIEETKTVLEKYIFNLDNAIFPIVMLKAKYFIRNKNTPKAIDIFSENIRNYTNYASNLDENKNDINNIITLETYHQNFVYFKNIFNYLFALDDLDTKIKKLYFELKFCLNSLKFYSQSYQIILELFQKYPDDIQIIFELGKDSVTFSKLDKYQEMVEILKKKKESEKEEKKKTIINNYILYLQAIHQVAQGQIENSQNTFGQILKTEPNNPLIKNNIALLNVYKNNPKECYNNLTALYKEKNSQNETIKNTINFIADKFNFPKID
jgi:tetratricopeptide (TPR) repeat protein